MYLLSSLFNFSVHAPRLPLDTQLIGPRVMLRMGNPTDWQAWRSLRGSSREFLTPWEPTWPHNALHYSYFCSLLRRQWRDWRQGKAYAFLIFQHAGDQAGTLIGSITLNDIQRGIAQKGTLGYWIGKPYAGQGLMTEAAGLMCDFALNTLRLHRVEASCLPHNEPSKALLKRLGFEEEGFAKAYLKINGKWADHVLWGKMSSRPQSQT
jgi:ribosomal-protein-alanine N-acetyltransferase